MNEAPNSKLTGRLFRRTPAVTAGGAARAGIRAAAGVSRGGGGEHHTFSFKLVPSPGIKACLPRASGRVTITPGSLNDKMQVSISGMPHGSGFDLFVIQLPNKPF